MKKSWFPVVLGIVIIGLLVFYRPARGQSVTPPTIASTKAVSVVSGTNSVGTLTLPAMAGQFHYITSVHVETSCTASILGSAALAVTSTNLPGNLAWQFGNICAPGQTYAQVDLSIAAAPLRSLATDTDTTFVCPAIGLTGTCSLVATYYPAQ